MAVETIRCVSLCTSSKYYRYVIECSCDGSFAAVIAATACCVLVWVLTLDGTWTGTELKL